MLGPESIDAMREHSNAMRELAQSLDRHSQALEAQTAEMRLERDPEEPETMDDD